MMQRLHRLSINNDNNRLNSHFMFSRDVVLPLDITPSGLQQDNIITQHNNTKNQLDFSF